MALREMPARIAVVAGRPVRRGVAVCRWARRWPKMEPGCHGDEHGGGVGSILQAIL